MKTIKRNSRSEVVLDVDDLDILWLVSKHRVEDLYSIRKYMNISYKGLQIHLSRMSNLGFIKIVRYEYPKHKYKKIIVEKKGEDLLKCFFFPFLSKQDSKIIEEYCKKYRKKQENSYKYQEVKK